MSFLLARSRTQDMNEQASNHQWKAAWAVTQLTTSCPTYRITTLVLFLQTAAAHA
jgi:hypothetical protein